MPNVPDKINMYNVYKTDGNKLLGLSGEITLPDLEAITSEIEGAGLLGPIETAAVGQFAAMQMEIPFRTILEDLTDMMDPTKTVGLTLRGSQQELDGVGDIKFVGIRVVIRGQFLGLTGGTLKQGEGTGSKIKLGLTYYLLEYDGKPFNELDKLNGVYRVNGKDVLAEARALC